MSNDSKGLVGGIQRFSTSDGPGIRTTVFLKGCPLACQWCHNPELINRKQQLMRSATKCIKCGACQTVCPEGAIKKDGDDYHIDRNLCNDCLQCVEICTAEGMKAVGEWKTVTEIMDVVRRDKGFYEKSGGGMTISGGELLLQSDFAQELVNAAWTEGITVALDTSGFGDTKKLLQLAEKASYFLYDMKCIDETRHKKYTGVSNEIILKNLNALCQNISFREKIIMRMPLIHEVNDDEKVIEATKAFYEANGLKKVTLLAYHELGISKCRGIGRQSHVFNAPPHERMVEIKEEFESIGMKAEILGEEIA